MAIIPQKQLFKWDEIEELGDLQRLKLVIDYLPDETLERLSMLCYYSKWEAA